MVEVSFFFSWFSKLCRNWNGQGADCRMEFLHAATRILLCVPSSSSGCVVVLLLQASLHVMGRDMNIWSFKRPGNTSTPGF